MAAVILEALDPVDRPPLLPPRLPRAAEVAEDPARAAVAAALAWMLAEQLGLDDTARDAVEVLAACVRRLLVA